MVGPGQALRLQRLHARVVIVVQPHLILDKSVLQMLSPRELSS